MIGTDRGEETAVLTFLRWLREPDAGIRTIYGIFEYLAEHYDMPDAIMVVESDLTGPQLFRTGAKPIEQHIAARLLAKGPGLYPEPDGVPAVLREVILSIAPVAIVLQAGLEGRSFVPVPSDSRTFEAAVAIAAANGNRYGWTSTVVVFDVGASGLDDLAVAEIEVALERVLRTGDSGGRLGPSRFGALLSNARTEEAVPFLRRLRAELGDRHEATPIAIGAACAPDESVDPAALLALATSRMA